VPTVIRKEIGRMNVRNGSETHKMPPRPEAEARLLKKNSSPPEGEPAPERKILSVWQDWKAMRRTRTDCVPFYEVPRSLWSE
jgi:hypothetical protein